MPLYNVTVSIETTMVVIADDEDHAFDVATDNKRDHLLGEINGARVHIAGEVRSMADLRGEWDDRCIPYGTDECTRIGELLGRA